MPICFNEFLKDLETFSKTINDSGKLNTEKSAKINGGMKYIKKDD